MIRNFDRNFSFEPVIKTKEDSSKATFSQLPVDLEPPQ
jgi:hypothetical protein